MSSAWWIVLAMNLSMAQVAQTQSPLNARQAFLDKQHIERVLRDTPLSVDFQEIPLHLAIHQLSEELGLSIRIDEPALAEEGVALNRPVAMRVESASAKSVLDLMLHQVHLVWVIQDAQIVVTAERRGRNRLFWESYPIDDLLITEADYVDERFSEKLRCLIASTVAPKEWDEVGGAGSIAWDWDNQALTVLQTRDIQDDVRELLEALRYMEFQEGKAMVGMTLDSALKIR